jgi:hypothetical protein
MNVFYWAAIVAAIGSFIAAIVIKLVSDSHIVIKEGNVEHLGFSLDGLIKYSLNDTALQGINMKNIYIAIALMSAFISFLIIPVLKQIVLILKSVEENKPFAKENAKRISIIGIMFILSSFIIPAFKVFVAMTMINTLKIQNITTNYSIDIISILTGLILFILSGIFMYGSYLQNEYDETV